MQLHSGSTGISPESLLGLARCSVLKTLAGFRGEYLVLLQGMEEEGGRVLGWIVRKGTVKKGIHGEED